MAYLSHDDLRDLGLGSFGEDVCVSTKASLYNCSKIRLGNHVRIDDFCVLSAGAGGIDIGNRIHLAVGVLLIGGGNIRLDDFANLSSRVAVYSSNDDYSGRTLTGPMVPAELKNVRHADVRVGRHVVIGSGSVVLPGVELEDGVAVGALSLVTSSCKSFGVYAGTPARFVKDRERGVLELEKKLLTVST